MVFSIEALLREHADSLYMVLDSESTTEKSNVKQQIERTRHVCIHYKDTNQPTCRPIFRLYGSLKQYLSHVLKVTKRKNRLMADKNDRTPHYGASHGLQ